MALGESLSFDVTTNASRSKAEFDDLAVRLDALDAKIADLDGDTVNITVDRSDVEQVEADLDRAKESLEQLEEPVRVRVDVDERGNAGQVADNVRRINVEAEGLQRGIGPLRGFTDELGGASAAGGVAANAMIDLGEAVEVFGSQLGLSDAALQKLSLGIGAVGIAVGAGFAVWQKYKDGQAAAREEIERTTQSLADQLPFLAEQMEAVAAAAGESTDPFRQFAQVLLNEFDENQVAQVRAALADLGLTIEDLPSLLRDLEQSPLDTFAAKLAALGISEDQSRRIAEFIDQAKNLPENDDVAFAFGIDPHALDQVREVAQGLIDLRQAADDLQINDAVGRVLDLIATNGGSAATALRTVRAELGAEASDLEVYERLLVLLDATSEEASTAAKEVERSIDSASSRMRRFGADGVEAMGAVEEATSSTNGAISSLGDVIDRVFGGFRSALASVDELADAAARIREIASSVPSGPDPLRFRLNDGAAPVLVDQTNNYFGAPTTEQVAAAEREYIFRNGPGNPQ
jgi:prefoldin subunit 5